MSTNQIIGCSISHLRTHLESKFKKGMNWENYGLYGWHIDHIIPLDSGKENLGKSKNDLQGLYFLRNNRVIDYGGWFDLFLEGGFKALYGD